MIVLGGLVSGLRMKKIEEESCKSRAFHAYAERPLADGFQPNKESSETSPTQSTEQSFTLIGERV
jgi:hypothetical protein